jgi:hypothetical protein
MVMKRGVWALWSRGTDPTALTPWKEVTEHYGVALTFEEILAAFLVMRSQGQHVRMEWMPEGAYGKVPKSNPDHDDSEEKERESRAWYGKDDKSEMTGFGYV